MKADIRWLDDPQVFRVNRLDAHSDHKFYENKEDYKKQDQRLKQSLNGIWKFHYSVNALERPADFYQKWFNCKNFDEMKVPQHIELAGYDKIHYINTMYPWEGHIYRRPAGYGKEKGKGMFSQAEYNPVGSYIRKFDLNDGLRGKRIILRRSMLKICGSVRSIIRKMERQNWSWISDYHRKRKKIISRVK